MRATRRALLLTPLATPALAQAERPIRFVVPYPPGGPTDLVGRVVAANLGVPAVVENRAGGSGLIGSGEVARAAPDGTTLLVNASAHVIVPHLQRQMPFDAMADFTPLSEVVKVPLILVVNAALPVRSAAELVAMARAEPARLSYASSSIGGAPHLAGELFKLLARANLTHVPYRGSGPALTDLIAGNVQVMFDSLASSAQHVREGRLRALAVTTAQRLPAFPELPTVAEAGVAGYEISTWYGVWGPRGLPDAVAARLHGQIQRATATEEARTRFTAMGADVVASTPAEFARFARAEHERFGRLIRDANIQAE
jgi:tripartite-type tricarboxylate transporter receptor subunit TctC